jgi:hypothetical protein
MRLETVRSLFRDPTKKEMVNALVQLLWMHRAGVIEEGRAAARLGKEAEAVFQWGGVDLVDAVLSDVQVLMSERGEGDAAVKGWFRA